MKGSRCILYFVFAILALLLGLWIKNKLAEKAQTAPKKVTDTEKESSLK